MGKASSRRTMINPKNYCVLLLLLVFFTFLVNCSSSSGDFQAAKPQLSMIEVRLDSNRYFLPDCKKAREIPPHLLLKLNTLQEAQLSGFLPAATCSPESVKSRFDEEVKLFGQMQPTKETEDRRAQTLLRNKQ